MLVVPLLQGYVGGSWEETRVGVEYGLVLGLVTTRVSVAVLVRSFVEVAGFVVLKGVVTAGGWYQVGVLFRGKLDVRVRVGVEEAGVVLAYTGGVNVLLTRDEYPVDSKD